MVLLMATVLHSPTATSRHGERRSPALVVSLDPPACERRLRLRGVRFDLEVDPKLESSSVFVLQVSQLGLLGFVSILIDEANWIC
jgi:hypothetical protein